MVLKGRRTTKVKVHQFKKIFVECMMQKGANHILGLPQSALKELPCYRNNLYYVVGRPKRILQHVKDSEVRMNSVQEDPGLPF